MTFALIYSTYAMKVCYFLVFSHYANFYYARKIYCTTNLCEWKYSSRKNLGGIIVKGSWECIRVSNNLFECFTSLSFKHFPQKSWYLIRDLPSIPYTISTYVYPSSMKPSGTLSELTSWLNYYENGHWFYISRTLFVQYQISLN